MSIVEPEETVKSSPSNDAVMADFSGVDAPLRPVDIASSTQELHRPQHKTRRLEKPRSHIVANAATGNRYTAPGAASKADSTTPLTLPVLRPELQLEPVQFDKNGQPRWTLQDPVKRKYYRLGWLEFELLSRWHCNDIDQLIRLINNETTLHVNSAHVDSLLTMLRNNELIQPLTNEDIQRLNTNSNKQPPTALKSAFRLSMFYRKPLVNPDTFLTTLDRLISPLYKFKLMLLPVWLFLVFIAINGVSAHWFEFRSTFSQFMTFEGFALFGVVLILINALHEIGHGMIAKHYRCHVTEMGVAFVFMLPICYCDTSDTWRLPDERQRLLVSAGGIIMELAIATVACLLWLVLPDGIPRTLAFFLAVTSLATTLFVNLNPFMKFDGYYLLSDSLGVDNLQIKSFSNFRWQLRQWFTGTSEEKPYRIPQSRHWLMNTYAASTWVYRLLLYFSICWMVYTFWFKALGLLLMAGVFITMIITPIAKESFAYASSIKRTGVNKQSVSFIICLLLMVVLLVVPMPRKVSAPAVLGSEEAFKVFATSAAQVVAVHVNEGDVVGTGQKIMTLSNPELDYRNRKIEQEIDTLKHRKHLETQWLAGDITTLVSAQDINAAEAALQEVMQQKDALTLTAAADGVVTSLPPWLKAGVWVDTNTVLAELASRQNVEVRAYVPAAKRELLNGNTAKFVNSTTGEHIDLSIKSISDSNIEILDDRVLAVTNGGEVAVSQASNGELQPVQGWVMAVLSPENSNLEISSERTGYVMFSADAKSLVSSAFDRLYGVAIRESGF